MRLVTARSTSKFPWLVKQFNIPPGAMDIGMFEMHRVIGAGLMGVICQAKMKGTSPKLFVAIKVWNSMIVEDESLLASH